jgi:hypothetical protein
VEALQIAARLKSFLPLNFALPATAVLLAQRSEQTADPAEAQSLKEQAVECYALAARYPTVGQSRYVDGVAGGRIRAIAESLPPEVVQAAQERGRTGDLFTAVAALLAQLA